MKKEEQNISDIIVPIICPFCQKELRLGVSFELLPPEEDKEKKDDIIKENKTK